MTAVTTSVPPPAPHKHRVMRGVRYSTISESPVTLPPLFSLDSAFQLQEYIAQLVKFDPHDVDAIVSLPSSTTSNEGNGGGNQPNFLKFLKDRKLGPKLKGPLFMKIQHLGDVECIAEI